MLKSSFAITTLILAAAFSSAQEKEVSVQFVSFPMTEDTEPVELLVGEGESIPVELPTTCLSPVYKVPAMNQWVLGKMEKGEEEVKTFKVYGKSDSVGSSKQLVLVLWKGETIGDGIRMIPLKYDPEDFSGGQFLMMNMTTVDIGIELGTSLAGLKPNTYKLIKPTASKEVNGNKQLFVKVFFRNNGTMKPFYSSTWRLNDEVRSIVFFFHEPINQRIRTHTIRTALP